MKARFNEITSVEQLDEIFARSGEKPVALFKHSLTCPISMGVYQEVASADADLNLVIVQRSREVSNEIARRTGVRHESPQAIVLKDGVAVYHASHYDVTAADIEETLN